MRKYALSALVLAIFVSLLFLIYSTTYHISLFQSSGTGYIRQCHFTSANPAVLIPQLGSCANALTNQLKLSNPLDALNALYAFVALLKNMASVIKSLGFSVAGHTISIPYSGQLAGIFTTMANELQTIVNTLNQLVSLPGRIVYMIQNSIANVVNTFTGELYSIQQMFRTVANKLIAVPQQFVHSIFGPISNFISKSFGV